MIYYLKIDLVSILYAMMPIIIRVVTLTYSSDNLCISKEALGFIIKLIGANF